MPDLQKVPTGKFHPGYGCAILLIMVLTFSGIVTWVVYSLLRQNQEIAGFTSEQPAPLPALSVAESDKAELRRKLSEFASRAGGSAGADLTLATAECNVLLALATEAGIGGAQESAPYPDILRFTGFNPAERVIETAIRLPMNKLPWQEGRRYLVGNATFRPDFDNGTFVIRIHGVTVPGKTVSEGFVRNLKIWDWLDVARKKDPRIADTLKRISTWRITDDGSAIVLAIGATPVQRSPKP